MSINASNDDEVDELFNRAKAAYRRERASEQDRIKRDENHAYDWIQSTIGFLTALVNLFNAVYTAACFITTAVAERRGLPDDCRQLTLLRQFRDEYILASGNLERLSDLAEYYRTAPKVLKRLADHPMREQYWKRIETIVDQATLLIEFGHFGAAYDIFKNDLLIIDRELESR